MLKSHIFDILIFLLSKLFCKFSKFLAYTTQTHLLPSGATGLHLFTTTKYNVTSNTKEGHNNDIINQGGDSTAGMQALPVGKIIEAKLFRKYNPEILSQPQLNLNSTQKLGVT